MSQNANTKNNLQQEPEKFTIKLVATTIISLIAGVIIWYLLNN